MVTVEEASEIVLATAPDFEFQQVAIDDAAGRVAAQDIVADRDFPPFDRVTMDGIAIDYSAYESGLRSFPVKGVAPAGTPQQQLADASACIEVMTGAMLPHGTNCVIRYEDIDIVDGVAHLKDIPVRADQNVHHQGSDSKSSEVIVKQGAILQFGEIGVAATVGSSEISVIRHPSVCIISTGDEIISIDQNPLPHQIRSSNVQVIKYLLARIGVKSDNLHLPDDENMINEILETILHDYDVVILSGGVSKGKFDFVPACLEARGVKKLFHRISQRPGKPFWFGTSDKNYRICLTRKPGIGMHVLRALRPSVVSQSAGNGGI